MMHLYVTTYYPTLTYYNSVNKDIKENHINSLTADNQASCSNISLGYNTCFKAMLLSTYTNYYFNVNKFISSLSHLDIERTSRHISTIIVLGLILSYI